MKITITPDKFHKEWKSTGQMIKETASSFIQTYSHPRFEGRFTQKKIQTPLGAMIEMETV